MELKKEKIIDYLLSIDIKLWNCKYQYSEENCGIVYCLTKWTKVPGVTIHNFETDNGFVVSLFDEKLLYIINRIDEINSQIVDSVEEKNIDYILNKIYKWKNILNC